MGRSRIAVAVGLWTALLPSAVRASPELLDAFAAMASEAPESQAEGARRAGLLADPIAIEPLAALLEGPYATVRVAAAQALGQIGAPRTVDELARIIAVLSQATADPDDAVFGAVVAGLVRFPFPEAQAQLLALGRSGTLSEARKQRLEQALAARSPAEAAERSQAFLSLLARPRAEQRAPADPLLLSVSELLGPDANKREGATRAIGQVPAREAALPFLRAALDDGDAAVRRAAAAALAARPGPSRLALLPALADPDRAVRQSAIAGLAQAPEDEAARVLAVRLAREPDAELVRALGQALANKPDAPVLAGLAAWAPAHPAPAALAWALERLDRAPGPAGGAALVELLLHTPDSAGQRAVLARLARRSDDEVVQPLLAALPIHAGGAGEARVLGALARRNDARIADALLDQIAAASCSSALAFMSGPLLQGAARARALALLSDERAPVRRLAIVASHELRGPDVIEALASGLERAEEDEGLFALFLRQDRAQRLSLALQLLAKPRYAPLHAAIVDGLAGVTDPRVAAPVVAAALEQPRLAEPAIDVLASQSEPDAIEALARLAGATQLPIESRTRAVKRIAGLRTKAAEPALRPLAADRELPVRLAARRALHALEPDVYPEWDPYGRVPLVLEGGALGATMMVLANEIAGAELSPAFTGGVGILLGAATPFLFTLDEDVTLGEAGCFGTYGLWGTLAGYGVGAAVFDRRRDVLFTTVGGEAVGAAIGALSMKLSEWGPSDALFANSTALESAVLAGGLASLIERKAADREQATLHAAFIGGALGALPMTVLSRRLEVRDDFLLLGTVMAHGAALGALAPGMLDASGIVASDAAAGALVGQALGYLVAVGWAQAGAITPEDALYSGLGAGLGMAAGGGAAILLRERAPRTGFALLEAGTLAGALTLGIVGSKLEYGENDGALIGFLLTGGALVGSDLSVRLEEGTTDDPDTLGGLLLGAGLGAAAGLALSQTVDLSDRTLYGGLAGGALLGGAGLGLGYLIDAPSARVRSRITGGAFLLGLVLSAPFASELDLSPAVLAYGALGALAGGGIGATLPAYVIDANDPLAGKQIAGGVSLGAGLGSAGAIAVAQALRLDLPKVGLIAAASLASASMGSGLGLLSPAFDRRDTAMLFDSSAVLGLLGASVLLGTGLLEGGSGEDRSRAIASHVAAFSAHGALHGALVPYSWRSDPPPAQEVAGGVLFGAGTGALLGLAVASVVDRPLDDGDLLEASLWSSLAMGAGTGVGLLADDARLGAGLVEGLGLGGYALALGLSARTEYGLDAIPNVLFGGGSAALLGALSADLGEQAADAQSRAGGALLGASLGLAASTLWAELDPERDDVEGYGMAALGAGLGGGLSLLSARIDRRAGAALTAGGAVLGLGVGLLAAPATVYDPGDLLLGSYLGAAGAYQGAWLSALEHGTPRDEQALGGGALLGASVGLAIGVGLSPLLELEPSTVLELALLDATIAAAGVGVAGAVFAGDEPGRARAIEIAGLSGLLLSAVLAPATSYTRGLDDYNQIALSAAALGYAGYWLPQAVDGSDSKQRGRYAALAGAGTGALAGVLLTQWRPLDLGAQLETGVITTAGAAIGAGISRLLPELPRASSALLSTGLTLGGFGLGVGLAPYTRYDDGDPMLVALGGALGTSLGLTLPTLIGGEAVVSEEARLGGALLGGAGATLALGVVSQLADFDLEQVAEGAAATVVGHGLGFGLGLMIPDSSPRLRLGLMTGVGVAGLASGLALAPFTEFDEGTPPTLAFGALFGAGLGAATPAYFHGPHLSDVPGEAIGGGLLLGTSLGLAAGLLLDQTLELSSEARLHASVGASLGAVTGAGVGLAGSKDDRVAMGLLQGLSLAGAVGLGLLPHTYDYDFADLAFGTTYVAYLSWHALGLSLLTEGTDRQAAGVAMTTLGLGTLSGLYLTKYIHFRAEDLLLLLAGNVWGTWIGGWGSTVIQDQLESIDGGRQGAGLTLLSSVIGSDIGLALTGMVVAGVLDVEPTRFAVINLSGLAGMMTGMLLASAVASEPLKTGNVIGSLSGLVLGAVVTSFFDFDSTPSWDEILGRENAKAEAVASNHTPSGDNGMPKIESWFPSAQIDASPEGDPRYLLTVQGLW